MLDDERRIELKDIMGDCRREFGSAHRFERWALCILWLIAAGCAAAYGSTAWAAALAMLTAAGVMLHRMHEQQLWTFILSRQRERDIWRLQEDMRAIQRRLDG